MPTSVKPPLSNLPMFATLLLLSLFFPWRVLAQEVILFEAAGIHMESAGGWVAIEKGFFGRVKVLPGGSGTSPVQKVADSVRAGQIAFGLDLPENILRAREREGIDLVAVSVDFQISPMRIISWHPVKSKRDLKGDIAIWPGYEAKAKCAVGKGWEKQLRIQNQGGDLKPWLQGTWPMASAMTYHELITAQREVKKMGKKFYTIDYPSLGIDWAENVLFTTGEIVRTYPEIVQSLVTGRYRGFQWAFDHPRETFEILKRLDERVEFVREMDALAPLKALMVTVDTKRQGFGYLHPKKWENIARDMFRAGLIDRMPDVKKAYTERFPSGVMPR
ncbi:MAG: ABC transporter substrate-binding protein [Desulfobacterota bacterium]|nr:ABC transporter substrate-binding protein [Thermodesulfobacteriota bacterium]